MTGIQDRPGALPWPPVLYLAAAALALLLNWLYRLPWITGTLGEFLFGLGWLVAAGGLALIVTAIRAMQRAGTAIAPNRRADHLVTRGPFALTRNPIYLGAATILVAAAPITGIAWFLAAAPLAAFATQKLAVEREERHLDARFGKKYRDYAKKVRRWI